ncbi:MAG TPA: NAD-dependent epimerase/dehydratase family protein [Bacteroidales bacterium]|nr:NAD-dependent epimerase/dehydratase family protein [Bacteroidales bacterium]
MILVTGSTGLAGSHLLQELTSRGERVRALRRKSSNTDFVTHVFNAYAADPQRQLELIEWVEGDVLDIFSLEDAMRGVKKVYHNAAVVSFSPADREIMDRVNVGGTANVVNAALGMGVEKLCHLSSIAALGRANQDGTTDETTAWVTSKHNSHYAISKYNGEREVWRGSVEGLNIVIILPSVILGLADIGNGSMQLFKTILKGLPFYTPGINGFVDVRDIARAQVFLMESDIVNEKFIVSAENLSYKDVLEMIARGLGRKSPYIKVSKPMTMLAWNFFKLKSFITGKPPIITRETAGTAMRVYHYSNRKFKEASGMEFRPVSETIADLCRIYRDNDLFRK